MTANLPAGGPELKGSDGKSSGPGSFLDAMKTGEISYPGVTPADMLNHVEPPSTVALVRGLLVDYNDASPRSQQTRLGPSELGTPCPRQIALKLAGVTRRPIRSPWAPLQGTAVHALMERVLLMDNARRAAAGQPERWVVEQRLDIDGEISGRGDAFDLTCDTVVDWKHTGTTAIGKARRKSLPHHQRVSQEYRVQQHLYGMGHERAGRPVRWVRLVMLARSHDYDMSAEWTERYRPEVAVWALTRYYAIRDQVDAVNGREHPERLAAVASSPGDTCKWCPFRRPGPAVDATGCAGDTAEQTSKAREQFAGLI